MKCFSKYFEITNTTTLMDSHKVLVTTEEWKGRRIIRVTTDGVSFSFDSSRALIGIWKLALDAVPRTTWPIGLLIDSMCDISTLYLDADRLIIELYRFGRYSWEGISLRVELPSSITVSLLTQVIDELAKHQVKPASE
jgi:hypothetical protein